MLSGKTSNHLDFIKRAFRAVLSAGHAHILINWVDVRLDLIIDTLNTIQSTEYSTLFFSHAHQTVYYMYFALVEN